jgi:hypothetical protein
VSRRRRESDRDLVRNAADPEQVARADAKVRDRDQRRVQLLKMQLGTYGGREFVWEELRRHGIYDLASGPAEVVYPFLGRRSAGLELLAECAVHPEAYLQMQKEAMARDDEEARESAAARTPRVTD